MKKRGGYKIKMKNKLEYCIGSTGIHAPPLLYICLSGLFCSIFSGLTMTLNDFFKLTTNMSVLWDNCDIGPTIPA